MSEEQKLILLTCGVIAVLSVMLLISLGFYEEAQHAIRQGKGLSYGFQ